MKKIRRKKKTEEDTREEEKGSCERGVILVILNVVPSIFHLILVSSEDKVTTSYHTEINKNKG
jgi:hypothetical protein